MFIDMTVKEFLDKASSGSPTPGGGSVCALVGALGAALSSMVGELTAKKAEGEEAAGARDMIKKAAELQASLEKNVDGDTVAFQNVMNAIGMPKATEDEKAERTSALQSALKEASRLPLETAKLCLDVMYIALGMLNRGLKNAASDASVSGYLGYAALNGALYNVRINLRTIKDAEFTAAMKAEADRLVSESEGALLTIKKISGEIIG